ncbi:kinase domain protein [Oesophagostomum dentatum]|uniref:Kinase domain protein n=1 Tax=Oesophagostomum dentatum TaxID=61180 RepID=A0A0B1T790_OESDE|nr:kinase domain protein [Oesophagostomum dentatum]
MMVSNIMVINDLTASRIDGARCSVKVLDGMCSKMASSSSTSMPLQVDATGSSEDSSDSSPHTPNTKLYPHPFTTIFGQFYSLDDFDVLEMLGEGFFSKVSKVRLRTSGEEMVLKVAKGTGSAGSRRTIHADAAREAAMLHRLSHENILALRGVCIQVNDDGCWDMHLLVDYCDGGSLSRLILDRVAAFPWKQRVRYALDISLAMQYLHSQRIIHRDLTSMNVLLQLFRESSKWGRAVVADFGLSCRFPKRGEKLPQVGTTYFMSPECLKEEYYDEKSDVFSFGVILCQLIARIEADPDSGLHRTSNFGLDYVRFTPCCPLDTPIAFLKLAFHSCVLDPLERPSFEMIVALLEKIYKTLPSSPVHSPLEARGESKLARSRSDAALKKQSLLATRKLSSNLARNIRPIIEGETTEEASFLAMEKLARDVARDEPTPDHTNPFLDHERFRKERKILPRRSTRRRSETKPERGTSATNYFAEEHAQFPLQSMLHMSLTRRSSSLPPDLRYVYVSTDSLEDRREFTPGGVPLIYRDFDLKFLKQMKRFPSRRHTLIPECSARSSIDLHSLRSHPNSPCFTHTNTAQQTNENSRGSGDSNGDYFKERIDAAEITISEQPFSCYIATEYSPNTGNRLNNNDLDMGSCEFDGHTRKGPQLVVDTVVRSPNSFSGRICGVPHCEPPTAQGKHQKCSIL